MINDSNIVIIGSGRGIGREIVKKLCGRGHNLYCISRNEKSLRSLEKECLDINPAKPIATLALDVLELPGGKFDLLDRIKQQFNRIDILLYNAGLLINKKFIDLENEDIMKIFKVNFFSAAAVIRELIPVMGGEITSHIVNIGSMGGYQGSAKFPGLSAYSASKAALASLSECLAVELNELNIRVNCLALGSAQTEMLEEAFPGFRSPLSAAEMAEFVSDFMVTGHKYFNGKVLPVAVSTP